VYLGRLRNAVIYGTTAADPMGHGDALGLGGWNIKVVNSEVIRQATSGGGLTSGGIIDGEFAFNHIHDANTYGGISLENQSSGYSRMSIHDNVLERISEGNAILALSYAGDEGHDDISIEHNTISDVYSGNGIKLGAFDFSDDRTNIAFAGVNIHANAITNVDSHGINGGPLLDAEISDNIITGAGGFAVRLYSNQDQDGVATDNIQIEGNAVVDADSGDYSYEGATNVYIDGVKVQ
jgi:hypothetical protein